MGNLKYHYPLPISESYTVKAGRRTDGSLVFCKEHGAFKFFDTDMNGTQLMYSFLFENIFAVASMLALIDAFIQALDAGIYNYSTFADNFLISDIGFTGKIPMQITNANSAYTISTPTVCGSGHQIAFAGEHGMVGADISIMFSVAGTGASIIGMHGSDLSSLIMKQKALLSLYSENGDEWQIISRQNVTERASA